MGDKTKSILIRSWIIGSVVVVVHFLMHLQHFFIGLILGIVNVAITEPIENALTKGNKANNITHKAIIFKTLKNVAIAIILSLIIRGIDYMLLINKLVSIPIEPFRFIIFYQIMYYGFKYLYNLVFKPKGGKDENGI